MKNPLKHLKHLVKDPINTMAEAEARKKEIMPWFLGFLSFAVVACVLGGMISALSFLTGLGTIAIFPAMFFGFLLFVIKKAKEKFAALTCNKCNTMAEIKTMEAFAKYVSYTLEEFPAEYKGISHPSSNNGVVSEVKANGSASAKAKIALTCPNCGNTKRLEYYITPFKCSYVEKKVAVPNIELVKARLEAGVKQVIADYNNPEKRPSIPYSIHSKKNPDYENRGKVQVGTSYIPRYNDVRIDYRKDASEMVEAFFVDNQLDGKIVDLEKPKKEKK